jgi:hypothetical protein
MEGAIMNDVTVRIKNPHGLKLFHSLQLPYNLELIYGTIKTTQQNLLSLSERSRVTGSSDISYIDGPLRKLGDGDFEFPLGKQGDYIPVIVHGAQDGIMQEVTVEYFNGDPSGLFGRTTGKDITDLSLQEYWTVTRSPTVLPWKLTLPVNNYSKVNGNAQPVIAWWDNQMAIWASKGSSEQPGTSTGSVTSGELTSSGTFTIAGNMVNMQPLSIDQLDFHAVRQSNSILFTWTIDKDAGASAFIIESSDDGTNFNYLATIGSNVNPALNKTLYTHSIIRSQLGQKQYYRLRAILAGKRELLSNIILVPGLRENVGIIFLMPTIVQSNTTFVKQSLKGEMSDLVITNVSGRIIRKIQRMLFPGRNTINLDLSDLPPGIYHLHDNNRLKPGEVVRFIKQ